MRIGSFGGYLTQATKPYIYNANQVSKASLNKIGKVSFDPKASPFDFDSLTGETVNPLKKGETKDYDGLVAMQMAQSANRAAMVMTEE